MYFSSATTRNLIDTLAPGRSHRPKGKGGGATPSLNLASAFLQGSIARRVQQIATRTPEAVMKVTGKQANAQHLRANFAYIGRAERDGDEKVELEDERGRTITTKQEMRALGDEWEAHNNQGDDRRKGAVSRSMVLSSPRGSDPQKVLEAAREWAHKELGDRRWVMALHTDTPNPHVHITFAIRDNNRVRSYPKLEELQKQREAWARELRGQGIEVIATPRKARGVVQEKENKAETQERLQGKPREREPSRYLTMMAAQRNKVIDVFKSAIADLKQSAEPDAPDIAKSLSTFVAGLEQDAARDRGEPARAAPPDRVLPTEREQILAEARDERAHRYEEIKREAAMYSAAWKEGREAGRRGGLEGSTSIPDGPPKTYEDIQREIAAHSARMRGESMPNQAQENNEQQSSAEAQQQRYEEIKRQAAAYSTERRQTSDASANGQSDGRALSTAKKPKTYEDIQREIAAHSAQKRDEVGKGKSGHGRSGDDGGVDV